MLCFRTMAVVWMCKSVKFPHLNCKPFRLGCLAQWFFYRNVKEKLQIHSSRRNSKLLTAVFLSTVWVFTMVAGVACVAWPCFVQQWKNKHAKCVQQSWKAVTALFPEGSCVWRVNGCQKRACIVGRTREIREPLANDCCCTQPPTTPFHLPRVAQYLWDSPSAPPLPGWNQPWQIWLSSISSVLSGETLLALWSSLSSSISASALLPQLIALLSLFLTESYTSFLFSGSPPLHLPCFLPLSLPLSFSSLLIFKSHMLPARLAQLHPANEGLFIGLRLSAAKQGLAGAEAGASSTAPTPRPPPPPLTQTTPHACSGLALSPRSRLLVSAVLNCRQQLKRARARERARL